MPPGPQVKFKLASKLVALELLGKHLGLFKDPRRAHRQDGGPVEVIIPLGARGVGRLLQVA